MTLWSRLVAPTQTKRAFIPCWWLQPGLKGPSRVCLKERHPIQSHVMCCVGGVIRKLHVREDISDSSPGLHTPFSPGYWNWD